MGIQMHPLSISDMPLYSSHMLNSPYPINNWLVNFPYLWALSKSKKKVYWSIVDELLVTFVETRKGNRYIHCLPFGNADAKKLIFVIERCLQYCNQWNVEHCVRPLKAHIRQINESQLQFLSSSSTFRKKLKPRRIRGIERHYRMENLLKLEGNEFQYVRRKLNKFKRNFPNAIIRPFNPNDYKAIIQLNKIWNKTLGKKYRTILDTVYFKRILQNYDTLGQHLIVVENDNHIIGMTSGGLSLNGESWCSIRKTISNDYDGLSETLLISLARAIHTQNDQVQFLNDGSDLSNAGLAYFKEKFRPVLNYKRYRLYLR